MERNEERQVEIRGRKRAENTTWLVSRLITSRL